MKDPSPLTEQEQADLVAYLDGELKGDAAERLEARISRDAAVRAEADSLKKAWDLLDFLPRPEPSANFTNRTLSRLGPVRTGAAKATGVAAVRPARLWQVLVGVGWLACVAAAGVGGYFLYEMLVPAPSPSQPSPDVRPQQSARNEEGPVRLSDLPADVKLFVSTKLWPMLTPDERDSLNKAEGKWPLYEHTLRDLAGKHEVLPPTPGKVYDSWDSLPPDWKTTFSRDHMGKHKLTFALRQKEKKWPDFALWMTEDVARFHRFRPQPPLGASRPRDFDQSVRDFIDKELTPKLTPEESKRLSAAEGKWPEYPRQLVSLARQYHLVVPGMMMPEF
jgi:hypothetical protein